MPPSSDYDALRLLGEQYETYIVSRLRGEGVTVDSVRGRQNQYLKGDTTIGLEIKYDRRLADTGNLYLETAEKTDPRNPDYVASGVFRTDRSWMYGIGNYQEFYVFLKSDLQGKVNQLQAVETPTSQGRLLPRALAGVWAARQRRWPKAVTGCVLQDNMVTW